MSGLEASLLFGCVHGGLLAAVLARRDRNQRANRILAGLLVLLSLMLFDGFLRAGGALERNPHLIGLTAWIPFWVGPLVFLYVREMTSPEPPRGWPWRHFVIPAVFLAILFATFYPRSGSYKRAIAFDGAQPWYIDVSEVAVLVHGIAYAIAALVLLHRHRGQIEERYSNLRGVTLRWLLVLVACNLLVWLAALFTFAVAGRGTPIVPLGSTFTVFVIGYFQLQQPPIYVQPPAAAAPAPAPAPYQRARLPEDDAAELEARIKAAMTEQRLYQRAGLTLADLADAVAATPHEVSQILSTRLGRNFYTFVNEARISHVRGSLQTTDRPVLDLAFEAGFQSKSTFNAAFRKATGMTPREFRARATAQNPSRRTS